MKKKLLFYKNKNINNKIIMYNIMIILFFVHKIINKKQIFLININHK